MEQWMWIVLGVLAVVAVALVSLAASRKRRSDQLREGFGPEYDRVVDDTGDRREAERELKERQERHDELDIRPLSDGARTRYLEEWRLVPGQFVDQPEAAVRDAGGL